MSNPDMQSINPLPSWYQDTAENPSDSHLLIIDDDDDTLAILKMIFNKVGYKVDVAHDGQEGLELLKQKKHDLVISDIMMPVINGYKFCELVRSDHEIRLTPILLITAKKDLFDKVVSLNVGADDFMTKPYNVAELRARVASLLKMKRLRDELIAREKELARIHTLEKTLLAISHHINNAIAPIAARAQLCQPEKTEDVRKLIEVCHSGCARITETIQILAKTVEWMKNPSANEEFSCGVPELNELLNRLHEFPMHD